jgi:hypothetical protein
MMLRSDGRSNRLICDGPRSFDFLGSLKEGKEEADARVERSLYQRAVGYHYDAVKIFMPAGAKKPIYAPYVSTCRLT